MHKNTTRICPFHDVEIEFHLTYVIDRHSISLGFFNIFIVNFGDTFSVTGWDADAAHVPGWWEMHNPSPHALLTRRWQQVLLGHWEGTAKSDNYIDNSLCNRACRPTGIYWDYFTDSLLKISHCNSFQERVA